MPEETGPINYDKPVPREPEGPARVEQVRVRNRRREYLERHASYFDSLEHELADAMLYERLIKRFQSVPERTAEGKAKGYGRTLEASLMRGETRMAKLAAEAATTTSPPSAAAIATSSNPDTRDEEDDGSGNRTWVDVTPADREEGIQLWRDFLEYRFVRGQDEDFDYAIVDGDHDLDSLERQDEQDSWFDDQEPGWASDTEHQVHGETGVQDF
ncbi:Coiled-coil domain containing protein (DUF2052) [Geosmithia morbida]|uniref:Coiled-coil domain containing protein (DUF2052) n=1 Tax=Geosmithia morbida TaxID=1094350 RepID=A0A9P5D0Y5_9HYPO|nr:Coiled-coil domain containing protein (DUF2052) [Geosmithia morbida]KAF4119911.1 Coiled-coil domain containing protein (DUF2052) [Geosmithia morbida]